MRSDILRILIVSLENIAIKTRYRPADCRLGKRSMIAGTIIAAGNRIPKHTIDIIDLIAIRSDIKTHIESHGSDMLVISKLQLDTLVSEVHDIFFRAQGRS